MRKRHKYKKIKKFKKLFLNKKRKKKIKSIINFTFYFFFLKKNLIKLLFNYRLHWYFTCLYFNNFFFSKYLVFIRAFKSIKRYRYKFAVIQKQMLLRTLKIKYFLFFQLKNFFFNYFKNNLQVFLHNYSVSLKKNKTLMLNQKFFLSRAKILNVIYTKMFPYTINILISLFALNIPQSLVYFLGKQFSLVGKSRHNGHNRILNELKTGLFVFKDVSFDLNGLKLYLFGKFNSSYITKKRYILFGDDFKTYSFFIKVNHVLTHINTFTGVFGLHLWYFQN